MDTLVDNNIYRHSHSPHFRKHVYPLLFSVYLSRLNLVRLLFLSSRICTNEYVRLSMCVCVAVWGGNLWRRLWPPRTPPDAIQLTVLNRNRPYAASHRRYL